MTDKAVTVTKGTLARLAAVGGLAVAALAAPVSSASASGTSDTTLGCYSTWGSTGSNAHCTNPYATYSAYFQNYGACLWSSDVASNWTWFNQGDWNSGWGQVDCVFDIQESWVNWKL